MTSNEAYVKFLQKVNKNLNSNNVVADKGRFVLLYRENEIKRINQLISEGNDERIREIQMFLNTDVSLKFKSVSNDKRALYSLPKDYLDISSAYAEASKDKCKATIFLYEFKDKNYSAQISDNYNKASFGLREAPYIIASDSINVFTNNEMEIKKVFLSYYRIPKQMNIEGWINEEGISSQNSNPEGDESFIDKVISMASADFARNNYDTDGVQINKDRIITNQ